MPKRTKAGRAVAKRARQAQKQAKKSAICKEGFRYDHKKRACVKASTGLTKIKSKPSKPVRSKSNNITSAINVRISKDSSRSRKSSGQPTHRF